MTDHTTPMDTKCPCDPKVITIAGYEIPLHQVDSAEEAK